MHKLRVDLPKLLFVALLVVFTMNWSKTGIVNNGNWDTYARTAVDIQQGLASSKLVSWVALGLPLYLVFLEDVLRRPINTEIVYNSFLFLWLIALVTLWYSLRKLYGSPLAGFATSLIILFMLNLKHFSNSVLTETLFLPLNVMGLAFLILWLSKERSFYLVFFGFFLGLANSVRPLAVIGFGLPLLIFFLYRGFIGGQKRAYVHVILVLIGLGFSSLTVNCYFKSHFTEKTPSRSKVLYITARVLGFDGTLKASNGPYGKLLMDIDAKLSLESNYRHRDGALVYHDKETYDYLVTQFGEAEAIRHFWHASLETIKSHPWVTLRNTALNILSYFANYDLIYLYERRAASGQDFEINPKIWVSNPWDMFWGSLKITLRYPIWILFLIFAGAPNFRAKTDLLFWLCLAFGSACVAAASLTEIYLFRYVYPFYLLSLIPISLVIYRYYLDRKKSALILIGVLMICHTFSYVIKEDASVQRGFDWNTY